MSAVNQDWSSATRFQRWVEGKNVSGSSIDAFSIVLVTNAERTDDDTRTILNFTLADEDSPPSHMMAAVGPIDIKNNGYGPLTMDWPAYVLYTGTAPTAGEVWGVAASSGELATAHNHFLVLGDAADSVVRVQPISGISRIGQLDAADSPLTDGSIGTVSIYERSGGAPSDTGKNEECLNITGQSLLTGVDLLVVDVAYFDHPIVTPIDMSTC
jgi:hypothetical protein